MGGLGVMVVRGVVGRLSAIGASAHRTRGDMRYNYTPTVLNGVMKSRLGR